MHCMQIQEFGTRITRRVLEETKPASFSELVMISGLTHGTDVWAGNAQSLVQAGHPLSEVIACRDDIMTYLLDKKLKPLDAFKIMESVRKGKGLTAEWEELPGIKCMNHRTSISSSLHIVVMHMKLIQCQRVLKPFVCV